VVTLVTDNSRKVWLWRLITLSDLNEADCTTVYKLKHPGNCWNIPEGVSTTAHQSWGKYDFMP